MRRPRAGDERSSQALGRRRGSARWPIRAACQELADGSNAPRGLPQAPDASWLLTRGRGRQERGGKPRARKRKARPGAAGSAYDCGRSGGRRPQMSPDRQHTCSGGAPGGASASSQGDADLDGLRQRPLARHPLASGGERKKTAYPAPQRNRAAELWLARRSLRRRRAV